jgi:hypothetical protein
MYDECLYAVGAKSIYYKDLLNRLERDRPGAKLSFLRGRETVNYSPLSQDTGTGEAGSL